MWKSHESERRLSDPIGGRRDRCDAVSSSPRPNLPVTGPPVTSPGFANRILGGSGAGDALEEPVEAAIDGRSLCNSNLFPVPNITKDLLPRRQG